MRCSAPDCGFVGDRKFCSQCGSKMIEEEMVKVICNGVQEDGTPCKTILDQKQKFCPNCGAKIDQNRFLLQSNICKSCQTELKPEDNFCPECGAKRYTDTLSGSIKPGATIKVPLQSSSVTTEKDPKKDKYEQNLQECSESSSSQIKHKKEENRKDSCDKDEESNQKLADKTAEKEKSFQRDDERHEEVEIKTDSASIIEKPGSPVNKTSSEIRIEQVKEENGKDSCDKDEEIFSDSNQKLDDITGEKEKTIQTDDERHKEVEIKTDSESMDENPGGQVNKTSSEIRIEQVKEENGKDSCDKDEENCSDSNQKLDDITGEKEKTIQTDDERHKEVEIKTDSESLDENPGSQGNKTSSEIRFEHVKKEGSETQQAYDDSGGGTQDTHLPTNEASGDNSDDGDEFDFIDAEGDLDKENNGKDCKTVFHDALESHGSENTKQSITKSTTDHVVNNEGTENGKTVLQSKDNTKNDGTSTENLAKDDRDVSKEHETHSRNNQGPIDNSENNHQTHDHVTKGSTEGTNVDTGEIEKSLADQQRKESDEEKLQRNKEKKDEPSKPQLRSTGKSSQEKYTTVRFHAVIGEEFNFDPKKHKLILRMSDNWDNKSKELRVRRQLKGHYEMVYDLKIPHNRLKGQEMLYKYCIFKSKNDYTWEYYSREGYTEDNSDRVIHFLTSWTNIDVVDQYDGQLEKSWNKLSGIVFDWKKHLVKHAKTGVGYFCKDILDAKETYSMSTCIQRLLLLMQNFRKIYFIDGKCWDSKENSFKKDVGEIVLQKMVECSTDELNRKETEGEKHERQIVFALAAVLLVDNNFVLVEANESWKYFCMQLAMKPADDKKRCIELDIMDKYFPNKRDPFRKAFLQLAKEIASRSRSPSWMCLMPWIHFLSRDNTPYETPPLDTKHDDRLPVWWGISSVAKEVSYFNSKTDDWDVSVNETLNRLQPMFEMDYYLPRTFITSLNLRQLTTEIRKGVIGIEVCLAVLIYHLRVSKTSYTTSLTPNEKVIICLLPFKD